MRLSIVICATLVVFNIVCDRVEAWAINLSSVKKCDALSRRSFVAALVAVSGISQLGQPVVASYGDSSNIELPSYIAFLEEKNKSKDPSTFLYQGNDEEILFKRLIEASTKLALIPSLAEQRKWSQIQGVLTGPLGTLAITLNQIASQSPPQVMVAAKKVKEDVIAISLAAQKKSESGCMSGTKAASDDLQAFVQLAFSSK